MAHRIGKLVFQYDDAYIKALMGKVGDDDVAGIMEQVPMKEKLRLLQRLAEERRGRLLLKLTDPTGESVLQHMPWIDLKTVIAASESDVAVDLIQWLRPDRKERLLTELRKDDPRGLLPLLVFDEDTAGGRMKTEIISAREGTTVGQLRDRLAKAGSKALKSHYIYVITAEDTLMGRFSPIRLIQYGPDTKVEEIMWKGVPQILAELDQEEVAERFDESDAIELPVVSAAGKLLGCITADDIFEVMEEEYAEDVARAFGAGDEAHLGDPAMVAARRRFPWLAVNLVTVSIAATVVGIFQDTVQQVVILAAFMPMVAGLGGNAAQQALGLTIRAIAVGEIKYLNPWRAVLKEVMVGAVNGLLVGMVTGLIAYLVTGDLMLAGVIVISMIMNLVVAGLVGVAAPLLVRFFKGDPALGSTIFVTAVTDSFGFLVFLGMATLLLT